MLPVSALVRDENMAEFTERLTLGILEDKIAPLFATGCKSFAPYLLRSVNRS